MFEVGDNVEWSGPEPGPDPEATYHYKGQVKNVEKRAGELVLNVRVWLAREASRKDWTVWYGDERWIHAERATKLKP